MSQLSPRMGWPFPSRDEDPWVNTFEDFVRASDASGFAHREDRNLLLMGGGSLAFDSVANTLSWDADMEILSPTTGFVTRIAPATVTMTETQALVVEMKRALGENHLTTATVAGYASNTNNSVLLAFRRGGRLYFRNGVTLTSGVAVTLATSTARRSFTATVQYLVTLVASDVVVGAIPHRGADIGATKLRVTAQYTAVGTGTAYLRLYDRGPIAGPLQAPDLRAEVSLTEADSGVRKVLDTLLTPVDTLTPASGEILNSERLYEMVAYIDGSVGDEFRVDWAGFLVG